MFAPAMLPPSSQWSSKNLPKRLLLSLRIVLALPKASRIGLESRMRRRMISDMSLVSLISPAAAAFAPFSRRYWMMIFVASVLPAPDSPVMRMLWFFPAIAEVYASSATPYRCGLASPLEMYCRRRSSVYMFGMILYGFTEMRIGPTRV